MNDTKRLDLLLVDEDTLLCDTLAVTLRAHSDLNVTGQAHTGPAAVAMARALQPDIVLMDAAMAADEMVGGILHIREAAPASRLIALSRNDNPTLLERLLHSGVRGYLAKSITCLELVSAIRCVSASEQRVVLSIHPRSLGIVQAPYTRLSGREYEILQLVDDGLSNRQIGARLSITEGTVKQHLRSAFTKLDAVSREDAANKALAPRRGHLGVVPAQPARRRTSSTTDACAAIASQCASGTAPLSTKSANAPTEQVN